MTTRSYNNRGDLFATKKPGKFLSSYRSPKQSFFQPKLTIGPTDDVYEKEADAVADKVMRMSDSEHIQTKISPIHIKRKCAECEEEERLQRKEGGKGDEQSEGPSIVSDALGSGGNPLDDYSRSFMESRFGYDFSSVKIHTDTLAAKSAQSINALAYTSGNNIVFNEGQYSPGTEKGKGLLAHELTHVIQQNSQISRRIVQRADLKSPRLKGNTLFEDVLDNKDVIEMGRKGPEVRRLQQMLVDLGITLTTDFSTGDFGADTKTAVKSYQNRKKITEDGRVGFGTIAKLDADFPAFTLPTKVSDPWSMPCILDVLCPWNKHLVTVVLPTFDISTFDTREFPLETWDGSAWIASTFTSGGFTNASAKRMGFLNATTCEEMAFTIYHEGWHGQQPSTMTGVVEREKSAYINAEQWSIDVGVPGQGTFTNSATGATEDFRKTAGSTTSVNETAAETFVKQEYGGVSTIPGERVLSRVGAKDVEVMKADGVTKYTRAAKVGESVKGTAVMTGLKKIDPADWKCP